MNYEVCNLLSTMKLVNSNMKSMDLLKERLSSNEDRIQHQFHELNQSVNEKLNKAVSNL